jgi:hypothetical protein
MELKKNFLIRLNMLLVWVHFEISLISKFDMKKYFYLDMMNQGYSLLLRPTFLCNLPTLIFLTHIRQDKLGC